jgi:hypothetical protein
VEIGAKIYCFYFSPEMAPGVQGTQLQKITPQRHLLFTNSWDIALLKIKTKPEKQQRFKTWQILKIKIRK